TSTPFFLIIPPPPSSPLFPYTTLFRSSLPADLLQSGAPDRTHGDQSAVGSGHHLHPPAHRVRLPGGCARRILPACDRLGAGANAGGRTAAGGLADGAEGAKAAAWSGASLRSRRAVRLRAVYGGAEATPRANQH